MQRLDGCLCPGGQDEVWQFDEQLLFQPGDPPANEFNDVIALLAARDGFRVVGDNSAVRPYEIVAKLGTLRHQLVQVLVDRIGVVGRGDRLAQTNQDAIEIGRAMGATDDGWIGTVEELFQYWSNTPDRSRTTGPTANTSRSR